MSNRAPRRRSAHDAPNTTPRSDSPLTVAQVAIQFGVGTATVIDWIHSGELAAVNVSRSRRAKKPRWRITRTALDTFTAARTATSAPARSPRRTRASADVIEFYPVSK